MILQRSGNLLFEPITSGGTQPTCGRASMNWETKFWKRIKLKNGRTAETLAEARELIRSPRQTRRLDPEWQFASELLARASEGANLADDALGLLLRAPKSGEMI
jgi:hypothetical protein